MPSFPLPPDPNQPLTDPSPAPVADPLNQPTPPTVTPVTIPPQELPSIPPPPTDFAAIDSAPVVPPVNSVNPISQESPLDSLPPFPPPSEPQLLTTSMTDVSTSVGPEFSSLPTAGLNSLPSETVYASPNEAAPPSLPPESPQPVTAALPPKSSPFKMLLPILGVLVVVGIIIFVVMKLLGGLGSSSQKNTNNAKTKEPITITYYGLWEPEPVMREVLKEFETQNPDIKVNYQMQSHVDYRERMQNALSRTGAPDVIRFHSTWLPMLITSLQPAPATIIPATEIQSNFYAPVAESVIAGGQVYAVPTTTEGLSLFANEEMLNTIQATAPTTWEELRDLADQLVKYDEVTGQITQAGAALGVTKNISHWPDIVSLMMLQNNTDMTSPDLIHGGEALQYYNSFAQGDTRVWDDTMPDSIQAFAAGKVAMIFAPSWRALDIQALNPSLKWKVYPVPQLRGEDDPVTWSNFWVEGVPKNAAHPQEAWKLVKYLASSQAQQALFTAASTARGFGQPPANNSLAQQISTHPIVGPFVVQASTAKTFYTTSLTHDGTTGINSRMIKYLENAVNGLGSGMALEQVIPALKLGFYQVLSEYNLVTPTPIVTP